MKAPNPVWTALLALLVWNYSRGERDLPTLCSSGRKVIPPRLFLAGWAALSAWLIPHFCGPTWAARRETSE